MDVTTITGDDSEEYGVELNPQREHVVKAWGDFGTGQFILEEEVATDTWVAVTDGQNPPQAMALTAAGGFEFTPAVRQVRGTTSGGATSVSYAIVTKRG